LTFLAMGAVLGGCSGGVLGAIVGGILGCKQNGSPGGSNQKAAADRPRE
jgi:hypothetical protein